MACGSPLKNCYSYKDRIKRVKKESASRLGFSPDCAVCARPASSRSFALLFLATANPCVTTPRFQCWLARAPRHPLLNSVIGWKTTRVALLPLLPIETGRTRLRFSSCPSLCKNTLTIFCQGVNSSRVTDYSLQCNAIGCRCDRLASR